MVKHSLQQQKDRKEVYLILDNIRSVHNVGSIFRTADGAGVTRIFLSGVTPAPTDRFGRPRSDFAKVALGAEKKIPWEQVASTKAAILALKGSGVEIIALEQASNSVDYKKVVPQFPCAIILGEEVHGISPSLLNLCDIVAEIPMKGIKESLNVSISTGIFLYRVLNI